MRLIVGNTVLDRPDDAAVRAALRRLFDGVEDEPFMVLVEGPEPERSEYFIQTARISTGSFVLEYREGSWDQHYQCDAVSLGPRGLRELTSAFIDYLHGNNTWKTRFEWKQLTDPHV